MVVCGQSKSNQFKLKKQMIAVPTNTTCPSCLSFRFHNNTHRQQWRQEASRGWRRSCVRRAQLLLPLDLVQVALLATRLALKVCNNETSLIGCLTAPSASNSPFSEPTSPNPTITHHAQTTEALHRYGSYIMQCLPKFIQQFSVLKDELTLHICPSGVIPVLTFLRDHAQCQFKSVMDITAVDFPEKDKRFEVVYNLLSYKYAGRIRVKTYAGEVDAVPSATSVFRGADW